MSAESFPSLRGHPSLKAQRGVATLSTAMILLLAITLMTFSAARVGIVEQKIAANDYRAKQALHAAEGALEQAVYNANVVTPVIGTMVTGVLPGSTTTTAPCTAAGICYSYVYASVVGTTLLRITATGYSDDGSAIKTVFQSIKKYGPLPGIPNAPVTSGSSYDSNSNAINIINNITPIAIAAQGTIDTHEKTVTSVNGVAGAGLQPNTSTPGITDVVDTLDERNAWFKNVFGTTKADIQSISLPVACSGLCNAQLGNTGTTLSGNTITNFGTPPASFIWVTGDTQVNTQTVIGSPDKPVVLVINGTLTLNGGATIYGFIYVTGNVLDSATGTAATLLGNSNVFGSIVSEENLKFAGTTNVTYAQYGTTGPGAPRPGPNFYVKVPGTWSD